MSHTPLTRILAYYRRLEEIDRQLQRLKDMAAQDLYALLVDDTSSAVLKEPAVHFTDPRYLNPEISQPDLADWAQRRYTLGFLLLETILGKPLRNLSCVHFRDEETLCLGVTPPALEALLNQLLRELLGAELTAIAGPGELRQRLRPAIYYALGMQPHGRLWVAPLVSKGLFCAFLGQNPVWQPLSSRETQVDQRFLYNLDQLLDTQPVQYICGLAAKAFCDWLSQRHGLGAFYAQGQTGFRLLSVDERCVLDEDLPQGIDLELVDLAVWVQGHSPAVASDKVTPRGAVFRFCINGD